jgi:hypothetical protein
MEFWLAVYAFFCLFTYHKVVSFLRMLRPSIKPLHYSWKSAKAIQYLSCRILFTFSLTLLTAGPVCKCSWGHFSVCKCSWGHFSVCKCSWRHFSVCKCSWRHFSVWKCSWGHFSVCKRSWRHFSVRKYSWGHFSTSFFPYTLPPFRTTAFFLDTWPLKMGRIGSPETSVLNQHAALNRRRRKNKGAIPPVP